MPNQVTINLGPGGLGSPLPGEDFISGMLFHTAATLPSGFTTNTRIKEIFSVTDAEALGITNTHLGETRPTSTLTVTVAGTAGDTLSLVVNGVSLGTFTGAGGTVTTVALAIQAFINAGTATHGFTAATPTVGAIPVSAPAGSGVFYNTLTWTIVPSGTLAANGTAFTGGVASTIDIMHYHIAEYFRGQPKGDLFVGIYPVSTDFAEVTTMQNFAQGKIRQIGVYTQVNFATSQVNALQVQADLCATNYKPLEVILQSNFQGIADLTTLTDLHTLTGKNVSVVVGQDGGNVGLTLWNATAKSIGQLGITLGATSFAKVSDSIAWVGKFNMASDEDDTLAFANGLLYNSLSDGLIDNIDGKGYVFLKKHIGLGGSYFDNPYTAIALTSDYAFMPANRTINKARRNLRTSLLPALASPVKVNSDGTLSEDVMAYFKSLCVQGLDIMIRDQELSAFGVTINPKQNVLATKQIFITVALVPIGFANQIIVNIGYTVAIN